MKNTVSRYYCDKDENVIKILKKRRYDVGIKRKNLGKFQIQANKAFKIILKTI